MSAQRTETPLVEGCASDCACACHTDVEDPGPEHLPTCAWADPDYLPAGFIPEEADTSSCEDCDALSDLLSRRDAEIKHLRAALTAAHDAAHRLACATVDAARGPR